MCPRPMNPTFTICLTRLPFGFGSRWRDCAAVCDACRAVACSNNALGAPFWRRRVDPFACERSVLMEKVSVSPNETATTRQEDLSLPPARRSLFPLSLDVNLSRSYGEDRAMPLTRKLSFARGVWRTPQASWITRWSVLQQKVGLAPGNYRWYGFSSLWLSPVRD